jgi:hypothetical protein
MIHFAQKKKKKCQYRCSGLGEEQFRNKAGKKKRSRKGLKKLKNTQKQEKNKKKQQHIN